MKSITVIFIVLISFNSIAKGLDVFGFGLYDLKLDGSSTNEAIDFRYEKRFDNVIFDIGPEEDNFFFLKPFVGLETTSDSAVYILSGIYLEDNLGQLLKGKENQFIFTPSFGAGYYDDG